jgi:competence protein ComEA
MRRREREQVAEVARRRLEVLHAELSGVRSDPEGARAPDPVPEAVPEPDFWTREEPPLVGPAALGVPRPVPEPGRHVRSRRAGPGDRVPGWLDDRLPDALRGRVGLSGQHGGVVLALVGVALAVAGWLALRSGAHADAVPPPRLVTTGAEASATPRPSVGVPPTTAPSGQVVVDVAGKVRRPGIVTLPPGSRVQDAIRKAGGARAGVALTSVNLARPLVDGEQILVGQAVPAGVAPHAAGATPAAGALVNLNAAGVSELDTLPGVGPVTAQKILDWRSAHGAFTSVDELLEVDGIGDKTLADIAPHVTL